VIAQHVEDRVVDWVGRSSGALRGFGQVELTILFNTLPIGDPFEVL